MLSRRHIRIKVMQSLYAYFSSKTNEIPVSEKAMLKHFDEVVELKLVIISLLIEIVKHADNFYEDGKKKHLPSPLDLAPNIRFVNNKIISSIRRNIISLLISSIPSFIIANRLKKQSSKPSINSYFSIII